MGRVRSNNNSRSMETNKMAGHTVPGQRWVPIEVRASHWGGSAVIPTLPEADGIEVSVAGPRASATSASSVAGVTAPVLVGHSAAADVQPAKVPQWCAPPWSAD
jgi:hypothetical protein